MRTGSGRAPYCPGLLRHGLVWRSLEVYVFRELFQLLVEAAAEEHRFPRVGPENHLGRRVAPESLFGIVGHVEDDQHPRSAVPELQPRGEHAGITGWFVEFDDVAWGEPERPGEDGDHRLLVGLVQDGLDGGRTEGFRAAHRPIQPVRGELKVPTASSCRPACCGSLAAERSQTPTGSGPLN